MHIVMYCIQGLPIYDGQQGMSSSAWYSFKDEFYMFGRFSFLQETFDLCLTAGPGADVSVGSCRSLISPSLTQTQLIDGTQWYSAGKLSDPIR